MLILNAADHEDLEMDCSILFVDFSPEAVVNAQIMEDKTEKLAVLWVSGDRDVAEKSCLMYTHAAKKNGWFDEVVLIVWGSSSKLAGRR